MKKIFTIFTFLLVIFLVSCQSTPDVNIEIRNELIQDRVYTAELKLKVEVESIDILKEAVHQAINQLYDNKKDEFGLSTITMYFEVYLSDETHVGTISYKVNSSVSKPGLSYINDNLNM